MSTVFRFIVHFPDVLAKKHKSSTENLAFLINNDRTKIENLQRIHRLFFTVLSLRLGFFFN